MPLKVPYMGDSRRLILGIKITHPQVCYNHWSVFTKGYLKRHNNQEVITPQNQLVPTYAVLHCGYLTSHSHFLFSFHDLLAQIYFYIFYHIQVNNAKHFLSKDSNRQLPCNIQFDLLFNIPFRFFVKSHFS